MLTHDRSPGSKPQHTEEKCWENFWSVIGEIAHRVWIEDHIPSRSSGLAVGVLPSEGLVEDSL